MNLRPLCTARVCPTISGTTVERRDQVLRTFLSLLRFITSTFSRRGTSTKGPFFSDLDMCQLPDASNQRPVRASFRFSGNWKLDTGNYFVRLCTMNRSVTLRLRVL